MKKRNRKKTEKGKKKKKINKGANDLETTCYLWSWCDPVIADLDLEFMNTVSEALGCLFVNTEVSVDAEMEITALAHAQDKEYGKNPSPLS